MKSYWGIVNAVIEKADVLILILDARQIYDTINKEIVEKVASAKKPLIYAITKADLIDESLTKGSRLKLSPAVFVSGKTGLGIETLQQEIFKQAKKVGLSESMVKVGVLGYPNVGKSSLINALRKKEVVKTSGLSGYTKFTQKVRVHNRILIMDTPGVLPDDKKDFMKSALIGSLDFTHVREPMEVIFRLFQKYPGKLEAFYGVVPDPDLEQVIDAIAIKKQLFQRGKAPDRVRASRLILAEWHKGMIKI